MRVVAAKSIEAPSVPCPRCGGKMRLFGIEAHPTLKQADLRTYVCTQCDDVQTEILPPRL
jgi:DNA-directed RNA polymerase subunit RPC12/RpoP